MTVTPAMTPFPLPPIYPLTQITPFTYRDGMTYLQVLTGIRGFLSDSLVPAINEIIAEVNDRLIKNQEELYAALNQFIVDVESRFDQLAVDAARAAVDAYLADPNTLDVASSNLINLDGTLSQSAVSSRAVSAVGGQMVFSDDPTTPITDGQVLFVYQGPRRWVERFDDGIYGMTPRWARPDQWAGDAGSATIPLETGLPGKRFLSVDRLGSGERDVELLARVRAEDTSSAVNTGLILRASGLPGSENGFAATLVNNGYWVISYRDGAATTLTNRTIDRNPALDCYMRFRATNRLQFKIWQEGEAEPSEWTYDDIIVGSRRGPGMAGLFSNVSTNLFKQEWKYLSVATQGQTAVLA